MKETNYQTDGLDTNSNHVFQKEGVDIVIGEKKHLPFNFQESIVTIEDKEEPGKTEPQETAGMYKSDATMTPGMTPGGPFVGYTQSVDHINPQGSEEEDHVLSSMSTMGDGKYKFRWLTRDDHEKGFLQLMSLQSLEDLPYKQTASGEEQAAKKQRVKPYFNKDEFDEGFANLFPLKKNYIKILVAELDQRIVFAVHLYIEYNEKEEMLVGYMHDLLVNYTMLKGVADPKETQK